MTGSLRESSILDRLCGKRVGVRKKNMFVCVLGKKNGPRHCITVQETPAKR